MNSGDLEDNAIEVSHVSKRFKVYLDKGSTLKEKVLFRNRRQFELREVLDDVSFTVKRGEAIGLIGHNGCGKSTTLKLLTRIMYPDTGSIVVRGRVSSLIELGAGFHPDMSGRENIYINASIFGLTKKEIDSRIEDIIAFSELESYIDNPVRTYSSGMYMRLAFSVAINVDADVLLIDEILAVGDAAFQAKCFEKLHSIKKSGTTIVLVSHAIGQVEQLCDRAIWIHEGHIARDGSTRDVTLQYLRFMDERRIARERHVRKMTEKGELVGPKLHDDKRFGNGDAIITDIELLDVSGKPIDTIETGESCDLRVTYVCKSVIKDAVFGFGIYKSDGIWCYGTNTRISRLTQFDIERDGCFSIHIPCLNLVAGRYWIDVSIEYGLGLPVDFYREALYFEITSEYKDSGVICLGHDWTMSL
jgi:ABC-2 type transport system ATP-binding protein